MSFSSVGLNPKRISFTWLIVLISGIAVLNGLAKPAAAQSSSVQGPISWFIFSYDSQTIRPLLGIPSATQIGLRILSGPTFLLNGDNTNEWITVLDARLRGVFFVPAVQHENRAAHKGMPARKEMQ